MILFSSGSTGRSKAALHDLTHLLSKFKIKGKVLEQLHSFFMITLEDLILCFIFFPNAGLVLTLKDRSPHKVLKIVEKYQVELLPTSPTFLNLILIR